MKSNESQPELLLAWETPMLEDFGTAEDVAGGVNNANDGMFATATS